MRYRDHRFPCDVIIRVTGPAGHQSAAMVNVSSAGARLVRVDGLHPGDDLQLELAPGAPPLAATVRWAHRGAAGLRFQKPLGRDQLTRLRGSVSRAHGAGWSGTHAGLREMGQRPTA